MMNYRSEIIRRKRIAFFNKKAFSSLTVKGPYLELIGRDSKGEFEILFDFAEVEIDVLHYEGPSGDGFNEPREGGYVDDYKITSTNIGKKDGLELIKVYTDSNGNQEEMVVTDPAEIKAIEKAYLDQLEGSLQEKFNENIQEAAGEEQEARKDPYNNPNL